MRSKRSRTSGRLTVTKQSVSVLWWWKYIPNYQEKLDDMFLLARAWRCTGCKDCEAFRIGILRNARVAEIPACPLTFVENAATSPDQIPPIG